MHTNTHIHSQTHTYTHKHMFTHMHTHTQTQTHTHTHKHAVGYYKHAIQNYALLYGTAQLQGNVYTRVTCELLQGYSQVLTRVLAMETPRVLNYSIIILTFYNCHSSLKNKHYYLNCRCFYC